MKQTGSLNAKGVGGAEKTAHKKKTLLVPNISRVGRNFFVEGKGWGKNIQFRGTAVTARQQGGKKIQGRRGG